MSSHSWPVLTTWDVQPRFGPPRRNPLGWWVRVFGKGRTGRWRLTSARAPPGRGPLSSSGCHLRLTDDDPSSRLLHGHFLLVSSRKATQTDIKPDRAVQRVQLALGGDETQVVRSDAGSATESAVQLSGRNLLPATVADPPFPLHHLFFILRCKFFERALHRSSPRETLLSRLGGESCFSESKRRALGTLETLRLAPKRSHPGPSGYRALHRKSP